MEGELIVYAYELLEKPENINDEKLHQVYSIACFSEMVCVNIFIEWYVFNNGINKPIRITWRTETVIP